MGRAHGEPRPGWRPGTRCDGSSTGSERGNFQRGSGNQQRAEGGQPAGNRGNSAGSSALSRTTATTVDALFAPLVRSETRGQVWLYINKQLKIGTICTGITDGTWSEIIETPETAQLAPNTEVVTNVVTGLEPANRAGQQGAGNNPLMPQRGQQPGRGGPGGGPGGGGGGGGRGR